MNRLSIFLATLLISVGMQAGVKVTRLLTEGQTAPLSIEAAQPRLSWQIESDQKAVMQTGYEVMVATSVEKLNAELLPPFA